MDAALLARFNAAAPVAQQVAAPNPHPPPPLNDDQARRKRRRLAREARLGGAAQPAPAPPPAQQPAVPVQDPVALIQQRMESSWIDPSSPITPAIIQTNLEWMRDLVRLSPKPEGLLDEWMRVDDAFGLNVKHTARLLLPLVQRAQDLINVKRGSPGGRAPSADPSVVPHEAPPMLDDHGNVAGGYAFLKKIADDAVSATTLAEIADMFNEFNVSELRKAQQDPNYVPKEFENLITEWGDNVLGPQLIGGGTRLGKSAAIMLLVTLMARFKEPVSGKTSMAIAVGFGPDKNIAMTDWKKRIERLPWARVAADPRSRVLKARWTDPGAIPVKMKFRRFADAHSIEAKADRREQRAAYKREVQGRGVPEDENVLFYANSSPALADIDFMEAWIESKMEQGKVVFHLQDEADALIKKEEAIESTKRTGIATIRRFTTTAIKPRDAEDPNAATIGYQLTAYATASLVTLCFGDNQFTGTYPDSEQVAGLDLVRGSGLPSSKMLKILEPKPTNSDGQEMTYINLDYVETQQPLPEGSYLGTSRGTYNREFTPNRIQARAISLAGANELRKHDEKREEIRALEAMTWPGLAGAELQLRQLENQRLLTTLRHELNELAHKAAELKQEELNAGPCFNAQLSKGLHTWNKSTIDTAKVEAFAIDFLNGETLRVANPSKPFADQTVLNGMCVVQLTERVKYSEDTMSGDDGNIRWANRMMQLANECKRPVAIMLVTPSAKPKDLVQWDGDVEAHPEVRASNTDGFWLFRNQQTAQGDWVARKATRYASSQECLGAIYNGVLKRDGIGWADEPASDHEKMNVKVFVIGMLSLKAGTTLAVGNYRLPDGRRVLHTPSNVAYAHTDGRALNAVTQGFGRFMNVLNGFRIEGEFKVVVLAQKHMVGLQRKFVAAEKHFIACNNDPLQSNYQAFCDTINFMERPATIGGERVGSLTDECFGIKKLRVHAARQVNFREDARHIPQPQQYEDRIVVPADARRAAAAAAVARSNVHYPAAAAAPTVNHESNAHKPRLLENMRLALDAAVRRDVALDTTAKKDYMRTYTQVINWMTDAPTFDFTAYLPYLNANFEEWVVGMPNLPGLKQPTDSKNWKSHMRKWAQYLGRARCAVAGDLRTANADSFERIIGDN